MRAWLGRIAAAWRARREAEGMADYRANYHGIDHQPQETDDMAAKKKASKKKTPAPAAPAGTGNVELNPVTGAPQPKPAEHI